MALPTGLIPLFGFVLTVGISLPVTVGAHLLYRNGGGSFGAALRAALYEASGLYLVGVIVVWSIAGGLAVWEIAATLLVTGFLTLVVLTAIPLFVGRRLVRYVGEADSKTALRYATYGWPISMLVVFGMFIAPDGLAHGHLFALGGKQICFAGHCGIRLWFATAILAELVVAVLAPGIAGLALYSSLPTSGNQGTNS